jgi:hypothetical protein
MLVPALIQNAIKFIRTNIINILIVIIIFLFILTLFSILGISFNTDNDINSQSKNIKKIITIEGMVANMHADGLCETYKNDPEKIHNICSTLTKENCKIPSCCGILNGENCVGGNKHGPTYHPDKSISWEHRSK